MVTRGIMPGTISRVTKRDTSSADYSSRWALASAAARLHLGIYLIHHSTGPYVGVPGVPITIGVPL